MRQREESGVHLVHADMLFDAPEYTLRLVAQFVHGAHQKENIVSANSVSQPLSAVNVDPSKISVDLCSDLGLVRRLFSRFAAEYDRLVQLLQKGKMLPTKAILPEHCGITYSVLKGAVLEPPAVQPVV